MKNLKWWSLVGMTAVGLTVAGCGSSDSGSGSVSVRAVNATLSHPSVDFLINGVVVSPGITYTTIGGYATPSSSGNNFQFNDAGGSTALAPVTAPTLTGGGHYTMVAYETGGAVKTFAFSEDAAVPAAGTTVRVWNAALDAGKLDVYFVADSTTTTTSSSPCRSLSGKAPSNTFGVLIQPSPTQTQVNAGTYRVCVTGGGNPADLRLDMPGLTTTTQTVATVILTPAAGGLLLNGATLVQQGTTYTATRDTFTRVRLAAATAAGGTGVAVTATSGTDTYTVSAATPSPVLGSYVAVPAGSTLNITSNGNSVGAPATALAPGVDTTLLVYGPVVGPTATLITDDNRLPTDATTMKVRLINGVTGANPGTLSLTASAQPVASGVQPGKVSPYVAVNVIANSTTALNVTSTTAGGNYATAAALMLPNSVNTVMVGGDAATPQILLGN